VLLERIVLFHIVVVAVEELEALEQLEQHLAMAASVSIPMLHGFPQLAMALAVTSLVVVAVAFNLETLMVLEGMAVVGMVEIPHQVSPRLLVSITQVLAVEAAIIPLPILAAQAAQVLSSFDMRNKEIS